MTSGPPWVSINNCWRVKLFFINIIVLKRPLQKYFTRPTFHDEILMLGLLAAPWVPRAQIFLPKASPSPPRVYRTCVSLPLRISTHFRDRRRINLFWIIYVCHMYACVCMVVCTHKIDVRFKICHQTLFMCFMNFLKRLPNIEQRKETCEIFFV